MSKWRDIPFVEVQTLELELPSQGFRLVSGQSLQQIQVAYETYGELNEDRSNAVLICHAITGDSHPARHDPGDEPGWWEALIGPGKAVDTDRLFVICSNVLGGCRGTTGPGTINPATGVPYGSDFPLVTVEDMVDVQKRLVDLLGIKSLHAVVGGSLGGHQVLCWATRHPDYVGTAVVIAASARLSAQAIAFDVVGRNAIQTDPSFHEGQYYGTGEHPRTGLALARMLGHITYLSSDAMTRKFDLDRIFANGYGAFVEGRLLAMLEGVEPLTLEVLNEATLAWVEREYHRLYSEVGLGTTIWSPLASGRSIPRATTCPRSRRCTKRRRR